MKLRVPQLNQRTDRVFRGGSWRNTPVLARVAIRGRYPPGNRISRLGFRPVFGG